MVKILVVFTGGTIGCTEFDGVMSNDRKNSFRLLNMYEETDESVKFESVQPYNILSENIAPENLNRLFDCVNENIDKNFDGIIVTHGTDTLQYTAAFLSYAFGLCKTPVVLVSANYPLSDKRSNGFYNFCGAVDFIKSGSGRGIFVSYKNVGENVKIHRASRLLAHNSYDDRVFSIFNQYFGEISEHKFFKNANFSELEDEFSIIFSGNLNSRSDVLKINCHPFMIFPQLTDSVKVVLLEGYHSGTLNTSGEDFIRFCHCAEDMNIPIFLTGACSGFYYESKTLFDDLKIKVLPPASPIAMYIKLWLLDENSLDKAYKSLGGDIIFNI